MIEANNRKLLILLFARSWSVRNNNISVRQVNLTLMTSLKLIKKIRDHVFVGMNTSKGIMKTMIHFYISPDCFRRILCLPFPWRSELKISSQKGTQTSAGFLITTGSLITSSPCWMKWLLHQILFALIHTFWVMVVECGHIHRRCFTLHVPY